MEALQCSSFADMCSHVQSTDVRPHRFRTVQNTVRPCPFELFKVKKVRVRVRVRGQVCGRGLHQHTGPVPQRRTIRNHNSKTPCTVKDMDRACCADVMYCRGTLARPRERNKPEYTGCTEENVFWAQISTAGTRTKSVGRCNVTEMGRALGPVNQLKIQVQTVVSTNCQVHEHEPFRPSTAQT